MKRFFILNADDFGMSKTRNKAVFEAYHKGFLRSASLCVNGEEFEEAAQTLIPQCPHLGVGIHLDIIEGRALIPGSSLTDSSGFFKPGFMRLLLKSREKKFLSDVESEFRAQIEKGLARVKFDHLDSHVHTHGIPGIFKIAAALAKEYGIPFIRTQYEKRYRAPGSKRNFSPAFAVNRVKVSLLNYFTLINRRAQMSFHKTNDFIIGVGYTGMMDSKAVEYGLKKTLAAEKGESLIVEALFHPDTARQNGEYGIPFDRELEERIKAMGFQLTNYSGFNIQQGGPFIIQ